MTHANGLLIALALCLCSCMEQAKEPSSIDYVLFSGLLEKPNSKELTVYDLQNNQVQRIEVKEDGAFSDTLRLEAGYYSLDDGIERTQVYLVPGAHLRLTLNTEAFDESIEYSGEGAAENNYLAQKALLKESFGMKNYYGYYAKLNETDFLSLSDSLQQVTLKHLTKQSELLHPDFVEMEGQALEYYLQEKLCNYESMRRFVASEPDFKVSESYPNPFANLDFADDTQIKVPMYTSLVEVYLGQLARKSREELDTADYYLSYMKVLKYTIESPKLRELLAYNFSEMALESTDHPQALKQQLKQHIKNTTFMAQIDEKIAAMRRVAPGMPSPTFEFMDKNEQLFSLEDLKGQLVYIDIWATWCLPCIREIPDLKELEAAMEGKSIQFVSICKDDKKEAWETMVADKELGGIQLFAAKNDDQGFFDQYMVNGIPRFILLDAQGKIIDADAKRPSDAGLKNQLESLLQKVEM